MKQAAWWQVQYKYDRWHATEVPCVGLFRWYWRDSAYCYKCYHGLVCRSLAVVNWCLLWRTLWIGSKEGNPDFYASDFFLCHL